MALLWNLQLHDGSDRTAAEAPSTRTVHTVSTQTDPELARRVAELEGRLAASRTDPHAAAPAAADPEPEPDPEQERARVLERFASEVPDTHWAPAATERLSNDLTTLADEGSPFARAALDYTVVAAECRDTMCMATLRWPSFESMRKGSEAVAMHPYAENCPLSLSLNAQPAYDDAPVEQTLILRCGETDGTRSNS